MHHAVLRFCAPSGPSFAFAGAPDWLLPKLFRLFGATRSPPPPMPATSATITSSFRVSGLDNFAPLMTTAFDDVTVTQYLAGIGWGLESRMGMLSDREMIEQAWMTPALGVGEREAIVGVVMLTEAESFVHLSNLIIEVTDF